ncbi:MAG: phosphatase PAP2 family protein [Pseudobdellovibrionaceae bacterium]
MQKNIATTDVLQNQDHRSTVVIVLQFQYMQIWVIKFEYISLLKRKEAVLLKSILCKKTGPLLVFLGLLNAGIALLCWPLIFFIDQYFSVQVKDSLPLDIKNTMHVLTDIGLGGPYFILSFLGLATGLVLKMRKNPKAREYFHRSSFLLLSLVVSGFLVHVIKFLVGRQRPYQSETLDPQLFDPMNMHWHWQSFPSGHSQVIATAATVFTILMPRYKWLWIFFCLLVGFSRISEQAHYLSDVIMGWSIGFTGTLLAFQWSKKWDKS